MVFIDLKVGTLLIKSYISLSEAIYFHEFYYLECRSTLFCFTGRLIILNPLIMKILIE